MKGNNTTRKQQDLGFTAWLPSALYWSSNTIISLAKSNLHIRLKLARTTLQFPPLPKEVFHLLIKKSSFAYIY